MKSFWQRDFACHGVTEFKKPWACGIRLAWKPFPLLVLQGSEPWGPSSSVSERCLCCPSKSSPSVLQTASVTGADAVGAAGAQCRVVPWRVSGYFNYSCRLHHKYSHHGFKKRVRKKEQFIGVNTGSQAKQSNKLQKIIFLLWKSNTLVQS